MMRSLYSGVSGLRVHQTKMDVIGNNIANVNTVGFKASNVTFSDIFYQTTQAATGPNETTGAAGTNAMQIGLGSSVASITASITQNGGSQRTDNPFDVMITGDSFFVVNNGGTNYYTKAGNFGVDENGTLCTPTGATVMGWLPKDDKIVVDTVKPLNIMKPENLYSPPEATEGVTVSGNINNQEDAMKYGADGKVLSVKFYDTLGHSYTAILNYVQASATTTNEYAVTVKDIEDDNGNSIFAAKDATGKYIVNNACKSFSFAGTNYTVSSVDDKGNPVITGTSTSNILKFDGVNGNFQSIGSATAAAGSSNSVTLNIVGTPDTFPDLKIDFSKTTMYGSKVSSTSNLTSDKGIDGVGKGKSAGNLTGISIDKTGKIFGSYDNSDQLLLGQIAVASFNNPSGLESVGNNMFAETQNSGEFDGIGHDVTSDGGKMTTGVLEMSNVDLSAQFTDMITTQRGFQANSRIITTSDSLLEELINLKR